MKRPSFATYAIGNPVVALGLVGTGLAALYAWWTGQANGNAAVLGLIVMSIGVNANTRLRAYARWKAAWEGMGDDEGKARRRPLADTLRVLAAALVAILWLSLFSQRHDPNARAILVWLTFGTAIYVLVTIIRHWRRAKRRTSTVPDDAVVAITIGAPLMEVPPLQVAYARLPEHCLRVLGVSSTTEDQGPVRKPAT